MHSLRRTWSEGTDEASNACCVVFELFLPAGTTSKDLVVELRMRQLRVLASDQVLFDDIFAEDHWLNVQDSYWEFSPGQHANESRPVLRYFLLKTEGFQHEPLYCLFQSELFESQRPATQDCFEECADDCVLPKVAQPSLAGAAPPMTNGSAELDTEGLGMPDALEQQGTSLALDPSAIGLAARVPCKGWISELILQGLGTAGQSHVLSERRILLMILMSSPTTFEAEDYGRLVSKDSQVDVAEVVWGPVDASGHSRSGHAGLHICRFDGRSEEAVKTLCKNPPHAAVVSAGLLESWYYRWAPQLRLLADRGTVVILTDREQSGGSNSSSSSNRKNRASGSKRKAIGETILRSLGCNIIGVEPSGGRTSEDSVSCALASIRNEPGSRAALAPAVAVSDDDFKELPHQQYFHLRRLLAALGVDFRPLYPAPGGLNEAAAAAEAARLAWVVAGSAEEVAGVAAGVAAGEHAAAVAVEQGGRCDWSGSIQAAVSSGVMGVLAAGGADYQAVAVGTLLGLKEGLYTWNPSLPLELHGAQVADVVFLTLVSDKVWVKEFAEHARRRKIESLVCVGGLKRPGECTIALCQALLGVGRPRDGSRLGAAFGVLRNVAKLLLAEASLPNLLDSNGAEAAAFGNAVMESMNQVRLTHLIGVDSREADGINHDHK